MSSENKSSFAAMFEAEAQKPKKRRAFRVGDRVEAVVVQVGKDSVFVEIDGHQQAFFEANELREDDGTIALKEGDKVSAQIVDIDAQQGLVRLGRSLGKPGSIAQLEQARESGLAVEGKVTGVNKGGLEVELGAARAFCPMSQIDTRRIEDADAKALIGQVLKFVVTDIKNNGKDVVVSRRAHLAQEASANASRVLVDVVVGATLRGTITGVRDFGAFVDLGGVEGMIPRSEVSHDRSANVSDSLKPGDTVEVQVQAIKDVEPQRPGGPTKKITLSLKALAEDPWSSLPFSEGRVVRGIVMRTTEFGRFVRIAPAVEGLLHVSELGRGKQAEDGMEILVVVKKIDKIARKISLVLAPDGAAEGSLVATKASVSVGAVVQGTVEKIETFGIFVQIDGTTGKAGRGLVPQAELGVPRGTDLRKAFPPGTKVTAKVLETGEGKIRLSIKGAKDAEERADYEAARSKANAPASLGTFADLLKKKGL